MFKFLPILEKYLMSGDVQRPRTSHYASDANACRRQLVYSWRNEPWTNPNVPGGMLKMAFGNMAEKALVEAALDWAIDNQMEVMDYETQVRWEVPLEGLKNPVVIKLDFLVSLANARILVMELKSSYGQGIKRIQQAGPKDEHLVQVLFYLHFTPYKAATLVYLGRDNGYRTEFELALIDKSLLVNGRLLDPERFNVARFIERFKQVEICVESGILPARDYVAAIKNGEIKDSFSQRGVAYKTAWQCSYCRWRDACWREELPRYAQGSNVEMFEAEA